MKNYLVSLSIEFGVEGFDFRSNFLLSFKRKLKISEVFEIDIG